MPSKDSKSERYVRGLTLRTKVMGTAHVDLVLKRTSEFCRPVQELVTEYAWGEIWSRPGLDHKTRSMLNVAMLTVLNRPRELAGHVRAALNNGVTEEQIQEVLLQTLIYCGAPAALESFRVAEQAIGEHMEAKTLNQS